MRIVCVVTAVASLLVSTPAAANTRLLDVPFVAQSELLCGGAAVSMVMRYWGQAQVYAEDFASLVDERAGGVAVGALARAVEERGWRAQTFAATAVDAQAHIGEGRPLIALIEERPGRLHYVVVVAWTPAAVVFHDPAVNPFRTLDAATFDRRWQVTGRTTLLVLPEALAQVPATRAVKPGGDSMRDRAGALFLEKRYDDAAHVAELAVDENPHDLESWQLLAASRFLDGDAAGALEAWNRRGEPRVDLPRIDGLSRTRYDVIADALALPPRTMLTDDRLDRAARRVAAVPAVHLSRVDFLPREDGDAAMNVAVVERPVVPWSPAELGASAIYAVTQREAQINVSSPSGNGELWTVSARWWAGRPRAQVALAIPKLAHWTGVWRIAGGWERQTYRYPVTDVESDRRYASISFGDWASSRVRWHLGAAIDRWNDGAIETSILGDVERRMAGDRVAVTVTSRAAARFGAATVSARWRSAREVMTGWQAAGVLAAVTGSAPLDLWTGGDTGVVRSTLLRAHPLLVDGAIRASDLQRVLPNASLEYQRRVASRRMLQVGWAAFVDATNRHVDTGMGLRFKLPAAPSVLRIDIARGIRDRATAVSASWQSAW
jgi:predicted double-glycine peptidase